MSNLVWDRKISHSSAQGPAGLLHLGREWLADKGRRLHSPHYDFNDALLPVGASYWVRLVERLLPVR